MARFTSQEYFDSAQDYRWEVVRASMELRKYLIRYDPLDSYDSSRRSHYKLFDLPPYKKGTVSDSDLMIAVQAGAAEAVWKWNLGRENDSDYGVRDFQRLKGVATFPGIIIDSFPDQDSLNYLTQSYDTVVTTAPGGQKLVSIVASPLSDSTRESVRASISIGMGEVWNTLAQESRIDSALDLFNIDSFGNLDPVEVDFLRSQKMFFGDSVSDTLQGMYGYNDSDWAHWMAFSTILPQSPDSV